MYVFQERGITKMAEVNLPTVKTVNIHLSRIEAVKFDGTNKGQGDFEKFKANHHQLGKN